MNKIEELENKLKEEKNKMQANLKENYKWGDREDNPIPEMLPNAGTNPDNIITTISGIGNDGGDW